MMWLAPRAASELRDRLTDLARTLGRRASDRFQEASTRIGAAADELTRKGQCVRDDVAEAVARGAHAVERAANDAKSGQVPDARKRSAADPSADTPHSL